ncbi:glycine reductase complex selenoprotein A [Thermovirga lienii DSM 17291]|jgi:betaine reductase|uniref:Glycine reductase complex selenoprotein A n=1 Tax=Thermovirga lienii (strain ATCC BAA-1197 / DSM 17291 / Cas60314) TaxID=580340 RepID=G7V631_THELD|nr:glycine reductase complex selenoprotein A [Thermovirga lienii DSM 17291]KUK42089.1 MAG: Glycine reductase complex selenoprotein A [Thermovirga lienii]
MDLQNQQRVKDAAEKFGPENVVVVLGSSDPEGAEIYAETVTNGDPTFAGPLAGVSLGLAVYHVFEQEIKEEADPSIWEEQIGMMEMVLDTEALAEAVKKIREQYSKYSL